MQKGIMHLFTEDVMRIGAYLIQYFPFSNLGQTKA